MRYPFYMLLLAVTFYSCSSGRSDKQVSQQLDSIKQFSGIQLRETAPPELVFETPYCAMSAYDEGAVVSVFSDSAVLRSDSSFTADTIKTLRRNTKVKILARGAQDSLDHLQGYWHKVECAGSEGYIWGPELALVQMDLPSEEAACTLLYGITGVKENFTHTAKVLLLKADTLVQEVEVQPIEMYEGMNMVYSYDVRGVLWKNTGFTGVKNLVGLEGSYGACGYENGHILLLWDGKKLYPGPTLTGMGDADVSYMIPYVYYPRDSAGLKDKMVVKVLYGEAYEDREGYAEEVKTTVYNWIEGKGLNIE